MPSLRDYRDRIKSVKSTRKITSAMKMVAASKLRRAQEQAESSQPYARSMAGMLARVAKNVVVSPASSKLLVGTGDDKRHLLVVVSADRGLCGGFNSNLLKEARKMAFDLLTQDKEVSILCVGSKARDSMRRDLLPHIWDTFVGVTGKARVEFTDAHKITDYILDKFDLGEFDVCTLIYNEFASVLSQNPTRQQLIPFNLEDVVDADSSGDQAGDGVAGAPYDFEPEEDKILQALLPKNIGVQVFRALLDSAAGEHAARMAAMDNATRNAGDMIDDLSLQYNRARQAYITKELIEIISGAEAL